MVFSQLYPPDTKDVSELRRWCVSLIDQLRIMFGNLDEENVRKAETVDAVGINPGTLNNVAVENTTFSVDTEGNIHIKEGSIKIWAPDNKSYLEFSDQYEAYSEHSVMGCIRLCDGGGAEQFAVVYVGDSGGTYVNLVRGGQSASIQNIISNNR